MNIQDLKADFFICHASEDKEEFVRDLAESLIKNGANIFYDEYSIKLGDSLTDTINKGIKISKSAILVLSQYFFEKSWTQAELQAIFHKARVSNYKILIIYHNITNEEVTEQYPLLADIKGINSKVDLSKIIEELFKAIDKKPTLTYIVTDLSKGEKKAIGTGVSVMLRFGYPFFGDPKTKKVLYEVGTPKKFNERLSIYQIRNERLYLEVTDSKFRKVSVSTDISNWAINEQYILIWNIDIEKGFMYVMIDGENKDELNIESLILPDNFMDSERSIIGCSLELDYPSPFIVSMNSLGRSLSMDKSIKYTQIMNDYFSSIANLNK